jgi:hypothetical protein
LASLAIIFFSAIIFGNRKGMGGTRSCKSSPLALVYHGLEESTLDRCDRDELDDVKAVEEDAERLHVQLTRTEKGWKFRPAE